MRAMRLFVRYLFLLILLNSLIAAAGLLLGSQSLLSIPVKDIITLSAFFSLISATTVIIFLRGQTLEPDAQAMHTLVSVSLKLLLDMVLALCWFFISKKSSMDSVFLFFVIYLTLTLFTLFVILKILKTRSL